MNSKIIIGLVVLVAVGIIGFMAVKFLNSSSSQPAITSQDNKVVFDGSKFVPNNLKIKAGQTVTWENQGSATIQINSNPHPIHTDYPPLNLGTVNAGSKVELKFDKAGVYNYHNHLNPIQKGTITVD